MSDWLRLGLDTGQDRTILLSGMSDSRIPRIMVNEDWKGGECNVCCIKHG